jgi:predicted  nucleic acid-binding Zn-ribbon protein
METTVAQKLEALAKLQSIDSKLDEIVQVRGDLPEEVRDLEDELAGYDSRIKRFEAEIAKLEEDINNYKLGAKEAEKLIKKYAEQQKNVRNNREYEAISKEVELQQLEIQVCQKKGKEAAFKIESKNEEIAATKKVLSERKKDLKTKKEELEVITDESKEEETKLIKEREKQSKLIEERLLVSYNKIRGNAINGLAVVPVKRDACGGCFNTVPPQRQVDIREKKKLIVCEHCGRIFSHVEMNVSELIKK